MQPGTCELIVTGSGGAPMRGKSSSVEARLSIPVVSARPSVTLTSPAQGHVYVEGNLVSLSANASDSDGSIVSVTFEVRNRNTQAMVFSHVDSSAPYGINLPNIAAGQYTATARALDNDGNTSEASVQFSVAASNIAPTVSITSPVGSSFPAPASLTFEAAASDADGTVSRVVFELRKTTSDDAAPPTSSDSIPPYTFNVASLAAGSYVLHARAIDNAQASTLATKSFAVVVAPTVQVQMLESPGAPYIAGGSLKLLATATVPSGSVQSVQFFLRTGNPPYTYTALGNATAVGVDTWEYTWSPAPGGVPAGTHVMLAYATPAAGTPQWSMPREFVVAANVAPAFVAKSEKPKRLADYAEPGPYGHTFKSFLGNVFEPGQQMELKVEFNDVNRNIRRIEYYLLAAGEDAAGARLLAAQNYPVPHTQTRYSFETRINVTAEMVRERMQRVYAIAIDDRGATSRSTDAPVAIRLGNNLTQACLPNGSSCTMSSGQVHRVPGSFSALWYDSQIGQARGLAGESYFDTRFLSSDQQGYPVNARGDDVNFQCPQGAHWSVRGSSCSVRSREVGTYLTYQLHFDQAGAFDLKLCFANNPQASASTEVGGEFGKVVHMQFETSDASASWVTSAHGHISDGGSASALSRAAAAQGFSVPNDCPTELRTVSILNAYGEPVTWPAGYRTRMRLVSTEDLSGELMWLALTPSTATGPTRFVVSAPMEGQVFPVINGVHPTVTLNTELEKPNPVRPGGTVDYSQWSNATLDWQLIGSRPADGDRRIQIATSPDIQNPGSPYRVNVRARLRWEDRDFYTPERSFYVATGTGHAVEWMGAQSSSTVQAGDIVPIRVRARFAPISGIPEVRLLVQEQATAQLLAVSAQRDANQEGCSQGWVCFTANWTVPAHAAMGQGNNQPAETVFQILAEARSGQDWATARTAEPRIYRRPPRSGSEPILAVDAPTQGSWLQPNASAPLRATISASGAIAIATVGFQRCAVANSNAQVLQCAASGWQPIGSQPALVSGQWTTTHQTESVAVGEARHYLYQVRAQISGVVHNSPPVHVVISALPPNQPPVVAWSSPAQAVPLGVGQAVELAVTATDPEGPVQSVEFRASRNGVLAWTAAGTVDPSDSKRWTHRWTPLEPGTWTIVARARDANLTLPGEGSAARSFTVVSVPGLAHETPVEVPSTVSPASDGVGATAGTFRVDETGAATYSIPLAVVPGRAGVAPEMALAYSSQGGMGVMGRGWSITGASAITRCRQTAEAGDAGAMASGSPPLSFGESDRYCLDGQRLMLISGSYAPTAATMEFRTEIDSFARIRAFNTDGVNGPNYFVVQAKDGTTSWYGDSINGQGLPFMPTTFVTEERTDAALRRNDGSGQNVDRNAPVLSFALARRMDSFGNYIDYRYETNQELGEQLLTRVDFTGKTVLVEQLGSAAIPFASIRFVYSNLPLGAVREAWQSGMRVRTSRRLDRVRSYENESVIREYRLDYSVNMSRSAEFLLGSVTECANPDAAAVCYPPTRFDWTLAGNSASGALPQRVMIAHRSVPRYDKRDAKAWQLGDVDGDGRLDVVHFQNQEVGTQRIETLFREVGTAENGGFPFRALGQFVYSLRAHSDLADAWFLHDFNGDGRDDMMLADTHTAPYANPGDPPGTQWLRSWRIYPSNGRVNDGSAVFNESSPWLQLCPASDPGAPNCIPVNSGDLAQAQLVDINGDSLSDVIYPSPIAGDNTLKIKLGTRSSGGQPGLSRAYDAVLQRFAECGESSSSVICSYAFSGVQSRNGRSPYVFDLNADGRGDLWLLANKMTREACPNGICPRPQSQPEYPMFFSAGSDKDLQEQIDARASMRAGRQAGTSSTVSEWSFVAQVVDVIDHTDRKIFFKQYARHDLGSSPPGQNQIFPVDTNVDGVSDVLIAERTGGSYEVEFLRNTGIGFQSPRSPLASGGSVVLPEGQFEHLQFVDLNNDGYVDLMYPNGTGSGSQWRVHAGGPAGFGAEESAGIVGGVLPSHHKHFFADFDGNGDVEYVRFRHHLQNDSSGEDASYGRLAPDASPITGAGKPAAYIHRIVNGYGADTSIVYQPLTNSAVYLREPRWFGTHPGNGSPVIDLFGAMYVVASVSSDAPGVSATSRRSTLYYQYAGAKLQAGGRGLMGFRQVRTLDPNFEGPAATHVVSITDYGLKGCASAPPSECDEEVVASPNLLRQGFPYVGMARESRKYRVASAIPSQLVACLATGGSAENALCYSSSGAAGTANPYFNEPAGTLLSYARNRLGHTVTATGPLGERSVFPFIESSFEAKGDPEHSATPGNAIATLSETVGRFEHHSQWGDLLRSVIGTARGSSYASLSGLRIDALARLANASLGDNCAGHGGCVSSVRTVNSWLSSSQPQPTETSNRDYWRLGRLAKSTVTHWRQGAHAEPASSLTRESRFDYELSSAARTGAVTVERVAGLLNATSAIAPNDSPSELKTIRLRDAYGNVTDTFVCSGDVLPEDCNDPNKVKQRTAGVNGAPLTRVHRHTRTEYDAQGRYPVRTLAPHYHASIEAGVLHAAESVVTRDALGNVTRSERHARLQRNSQNDAWTTATYGPLGRQQTSTDSTGAKSVSEFHWCGGSGSSGQVAACPSDIGAVFRKTSYALGGSRSVTYFDRLGREVFALSESFNRYDENAANDWVGVCKTYDGRGRTVAVTEPFFVGNVAISGLRPELSTAVGCASKPSTRTTYDVLDRALTIRLPEDIGGTTVARTEMEYRGLSTTTRTHLSRATAPFATPTVVTLSEVKLHDPTGLVLTVTDAEGLEAKYAHDAAGNLVALKRNAGNGEIVSTIRYDALGRKISQNDPDAGTASYAYNAAGELICSQDARGYATVTDFDALGRSWRSRTLRSTCASTTNEAITTSNAEASVLPTAAPGEHSSVDLTVYDLATNGMGQIESTLRRHRVGSTYGGYRGAAADQGEFQQTFTYDSFGRPIQVSTRFREPNLGGTGLVERSFTQGTTYDALGRVATTQDATGGVVENMYSAHGVLRRVRDAGPSSLVFWELLETDVRGQTTLDRRHGKVELTQKREYNEVTGRLARIATGRLSNGEIIDPVQKLSYTFDAQGNLLSRRDERSTSAAAHLTETFVYDSLNRLTLARAATGVVSLANPGFETMSLAYDKLGNICRKGTIHYQYKDARSGCQADTSTTQVSQHAGPHAVTRRGTLQYIYDAAGNMTDTLGGPHGTRTVRFDGGGNADRLVISNQSTSFWYAGGGRYLRLDESGDSPAKLTRYLGGVEWILRSGGGVEERKRSIGGFLLLTETVSGPQQPPTRKYRYLLTDHLGSTDTLVDENGAVVERMSFDAHGSRRAAASGTGLWASLLPAVAPTDINPQVNAETTRGFTGHEHVDRMGLIHMNGRLYDPLLGRMLSPDPIVQEPYNAQNLNRYSYVLNNPLSYTDPSGLSFVKKYWRQILVAAISIFVPPLGAWGAVTMGAVSGYISTGTLEGALIGGFSAGVFWSIGQAFQSVNTGAGTGFAGTGFTETQFAGKVLAHATTGGVMSVLQGGKFGHGFASAGISQAAVPATHGVQSMAARTVIHAVVGGTASVASGGKFANGAITAAMAFAYNDKSHPPSQDDVPVNVAAEQQVGEAVISLLTAPWGGPSGAEDAFYCIWKCGLPGDGSLGSILGALPPVMGVASNSARGWLSAGVKPGAGVALSFRSGALQKIFGKHGVDFGLSGNWSLDRGYDSMRAVYAHLGDPATKGFIASYRGTPHYHYLNPITGLNVVVSPTSGYVTGYRLGVKNGRDQVHDLLIRGNLH
jgi:RHS repeat-associated protein